MESGEAVRLGVVDRGYCLLKEERERWVVGDLILRIGVRVSTYGVTGLAY